MTEHNYLNVYRGRDAVQQYFNPDSSPPLPLVELPASLNPYHQDGVHIYAKLMSMHPANNVKCMPGECYKPLLITLILILTLLL